MESGHREGLESLGPGRPEAELLNNVAALALREPRVDVLSATASRIGLPALNMTTGGLWRVQGMAGGEDASLPPREFSVVVKLLQSPLLWSGIERVPEEYREALAANYPWRTEAEVYTSGLSEALPANSRLPELFRVVELGPDRAAIWMEDIAPDGNPEWSDKHFRDAARVLGLLAGTPEVRQCSEAIQDTRRPDRLKYFLSGVGDAVLIPAIKGQDLWEHPAIAAHSDPALVEGLRSFADQCPLLVDEMMTLPALPAHGDACPQNFLIEGADPVTGLTNFVLVDWGMFGEVCVGYDLGQLLAGRVNDGTLPGTALERLEPICVDAYLDGLGRSASAVSRGEVRRGLAISMAVFAGLTAVVSDRLADGDSAEVRSLMAGRLDMARFLLDLLQQTRP